MTIAIPSVTARRPATSAVAAGAVVLGGCVALALVDPAGGPTLCPFKAWTGLDCPGCGITRAAHQLLSGHLMAALDLNVLIVLVLPVLAWTAFGLLRQTFGGTRYRMPTVSPRVLIGAIVVVAAFGIVRNLPMEPFHWLGTA